MEELLKLVVFVPEEHEAALRHPLAGAGAGTIGNYEHVSFVSPGRGYCRPMEGPNPHIGHGETISEVRECRVALLIHDPTIPLLRTSAARPSADRTRKGGDPWV